MRNQSGKSTVRAQLRSDVVLWIVIVMFWREDFSAGMSAHTAIKTHHNCRTYLGSIVDGAALMKCVKVGDIQALPACPLPVVSHCLRG